jgi:iron complex outermembrane receptor protein
MAAFLLLPGGTSLGAQEDSATTRLDPVVVTVTRSSGRSLLGSPFALTVTRPDSARPGQRLTAVDEFLALIPGLSSATRNNPSQDPRLSIRGFGARSAFGVRGVRVLRDGMPLTLPDGQTPLDYMSLESVGRIEVMRGSASALYGNASGGVIDILSAEPSASPLSVDAKQWAGSDDFLRSVVAISGTAAGIGYVADVARTSSDGARDHSRSRSFTGFGRALYGAGRSRFSLTFMGLDNPLAQNPGALTIDELREKPRAADPQSVRRNARKAVRQVQVGSSLTHELPRGNVALSAFGGSRSLDNPLTFAVVEIGRHTWGASGAFRQKLGMGALNHDVALGIDLQWQNDLRRNHAVCADTVAPTAPTASCPDITSGRGVVTLDQRELVSSTGVYFSDDIRLTSRLSITGGIRADRVRFEVQDRLIAAGNPDDSGERSLHSVNPIAGIVARLTPLTSLYINVSSAFETPTATELGNQPGGSAGINEELDPQRSVTLESGIRGFSGKLAYDFAAYSTRVTDELVPFEIPGGNGRRYFRNAGRTSRRGIEASGELRLRMLAVTASYNYSRFRFEEFISGTADYGDNEIPGIPRHRVQAAATVSGRGCFVVLESELSGASFADDANTFRAPDYSVFHLRAGVKPKRGRGRISVVAGIQNLFDRAYAPSIAVNAARSRYFEPAPPRSLSLGVSIGSELSASAESRRFLP